MKSIRHSYSFVLATLAALAVHGQGVPLAFHGLTECGVKCLESALENVQDPGCRASNSCICSSPGLTSSAISCIFSTCPLEDRYGNQRALNWACASSVLDTSWTVPQVSSNPLSRPYPPSSLVVAPLEQIPSTRSLVSIGGAHTYATLNIADDIVHSPSTNSVQTSPALFHPSSIPLPFTVDAGDLRIHPSSATAPVTTSQAFSTTSRTERRVMTTSTATYTSVTEGTAGPSTVVVVQTVGVDDRGDIVDETGLLSGAPKLALEKWVAGGIVVGCFLVKAVI